MEKKFGIHHLIQKILITKTTPNWGQHAIITTLTTNTQFQCPPMPNMDIPHQIWIKELASTRAKKEARNILYKHNRKSI